MSLDIMMIDNYCAHCRRGDEVFSQNITHNLAKMAEFAGCYAAVWRPDENGFELASQMIPVLKSALIKLVEEKEAAMKFNPENGWGSYGRLVNFLTEYLTACKMYPNAIIKVDR